MGNWTVLSTRRTLPKDLYRAPVTPTYRVSIGERAKLPFLSRRAVPSFHIGDAEKTLFRRSVNSRGTVLG